MSAFQLEFIPQSELSNVTYLQYSDAYDYISVTYVANDTTHEVEFKGEDYSDDEFPPDETVWFRDNLPKMTSLQRLDYLTEDPTSMNFAFLANKPNSLTELSISHLKGLDMNFLVGVKRLTLNEVYVEDEETFVNLFKELEHAPYTLETLEINYIDISMKELFDNAKTPYKIEYKY